MLSDAEALRDFAPLSASIAAFFIAAVTVPLSHRRTEMVILAVLVGLVVAAGRLAGRPAALSCAVMTAFSYDFFHVEPIRVLHGRTLLLLLVALGVLAAIAGRPPQRSPAAGR